MIPSCGRAGAPANCSRCGRATHIANGGAPGNCAERSSLEADGTSFEAVEHLWGPSDVGSLRPPVCGVHETHEASFFSLFELARAAFVSPPCYCLIVSPRLASSSCVLLADLAAISADAVDTLTSPPRACPRHERCARHGQTARVFQRLCLSLFLFAAISRPLAVCNLWILHRNQPVTSLHDI